MSMLSSIAMQVVSTYCAFETSQKKKAQEAMLGDVAASETGSNPRSVVNKHMNYISGRVVKRSFTSFTEGKCIIHRKLKKKNILDK